MKVSVYIYSDIDNSFRDEMADLLFVLFFPLLFSSLSFLYSFSLTVTQYSVFIQSDCDTVFCIHPVWLWHSILYSSSLTVTTVFSIHSVWQWHSFLYSFSLTVTTVFSIHPVWQWHSILYSSSLTVTTVFCMLSVWRWLQFSVSHSLSFNIFTLMFVVSINNLPVIMTTFNAFLEEHQACFCWLHCHCDINLQVYIYPLWWHHSNEQTPPKTSSVDKHFKNL